MEFGLSKILLTSILGSYLFLLVVMVTMNIDNNLDTYAQLGMSQQQEQPDPTLNEQSNNNSTFDTPVVSSAAIPVQGSYADNSSGVEVAFPSGWNGYESIDSDNVKTVMVSMQPSSSSSSLNFADSIPPYIFVEISPKNTMLNNDKQLHYKNIINYNNIESTKSCNLLSSNNITINSVPAKEIAYSCPFPFNPSIKQLTKAIAIDTSQDNLAVEFTAVSESNYEKYLPDFENSVKSIKFSE
jgi:hypothetical protein